MTALFKSPPAGFPSDREEVGNTSFVRLVEARRPRVLILAQLPPPEHGASAVNMQVVNSRALASRFDLDVVSTSMAGDLTRIRRFELGKVWRSLALYLRVARRMIGAAKPDLAYVTLTPSGWAFYRDVLLTTLLRMAGVKRVFHLHGRGFATAVAAAPWKRALYRFVFEDAHVIVLGEMLYGEVAEWVPPERAFVVPNGVRDLRAADRLTLRSGGHLRFRAGPPQILFLSNMLEEKGPLLLLEALAMLAHGGIDFHAVFAGAWRGTVTPMDFAVRAHELGLDDHVSHLGPLHGDAKNDAFMDADIFVLPTHYENEALPLVVIEAMMHGLPVVTTAVGALPELVIDGETGDVVEPRSPAGLAKALGRLLCEPERRARYGAAGRVKFEAGLTDLHFEQRMLKCLCGVVLP